MTARFGMKRLAWGVRLETRLLQRLGFLAGFLILTLGMVAGLDPDRDFSGPRAPLTLAYIAAMLACLAAAVAVRVLEVDGTTRELRTAWRVARLKVARRVRPVEEGALLRLRKLREERALFRLELEVGSGCFVIDTSSWRSELEPLGREISSLLRLPFVLPALPESGPRVLR